MAGLAHVFVDDLDAPALSPVDSHHLRRVLRLRPGAEVTAADGRGGVRPCRLLGGGELEAAGPVDRAPRRQPAIGVGLAPVKGERPEWAVQKLTELGVDHIIALDTARGVVRWEPERAVRHLDRWRRVAREAAMQSRQRWLPEVSGPLDVAACLARFPGGVALAHPGGAPPLLTEPVVLVGPEGGWTDQELEVGAATVALGPAVLRSETAAVTAAALLGALRAGLVRPQSAVNPD